MPEPEYRVEYHDLADLELHEWVAQGLAAFELLLLAHARFGTYLEEQGQ